MGNVDEDKNTDVTNGARVRGLILTPKEFANSKIPQVSFEKNWEDIDWRKVDAELKELDLGLTAEELSSSMKLKHQEIRKYEEKLIGEMNSDDVALQGHTTKRHGLWKME